MQPLAAAPTLVWRGPGLGEAGSLSRGWAPRVWGPDKESRRGLRPTDAHRPGMHRALYPHRAGGPWLLNLVSAAPLSKLLQVLWDSTPFDTSKLTLMEYGIFCWKHISCIVS